MRIATISLSFVLAFAFATGARAAVRAATPPPYPLMAPLERYMSVDAGAEIALAQSAAPESISHAATILVLGKNGYRTAARGTNGFTCLVERSWMSPFDNAGFWNPKIRGPICYNPPATRSILPYTRFRTTLVLRGLSKPQIHARIVAALAKKALPVPESGAMSYMMSKGQYLGDGVGSWRPHLMFHTPKTAAAAWGANVRLSPVMYDDGDRDTPEPESIFMIALPHWSDGSAAPKRM